MHRTGLKHIFFVFFAICVVLFSTCKKELSSESVIYENNFETADLSKINNGAIDIFNGSHVLGRYFNGYFELNLTDLPSHSLVNVSFDLYIHDSWDGNAAYGNNYVGPDQWQMTLDSSSYINTTFSNLPCTSGNICPPQSYPLTYPGVNNPRTGAANANLPGACLLKASPDGTTLYKINKTIAHSNSTMLLKCVDHLKEQGVTDPKCSESWSVDNIKITLIR